MRKRGAVREGVPFFQKVIPGSRGGDSSEISEANKITVINSVMFVRVCSLWWGVAVRGEGVARRNSAGHLTMMVQEGRR